MTRIEQFDYVEVISDNLNLKEILNREGVVIGFSETESARWCAVYIDGETWMIQDNELLRLGRKANHDDIYPPPV
ncbi:hypothetical protein [Acidovorax sp. SUPP3334]|uniref:hypothetical protein n=1 Tax=Acidovorax sp. SUPP3334 TaxID=2920881 RepID=UPI0023DE50DF|nr:hypothetical protein [Acidovorax sp. SUPP3334]GKT23769.1 hypothetical protein AVHM3334_12685 [Acidovorax sp. SUPP3334]